MRVLSKASLSCSLLFALASSSVLASPQTPEAFFKAQTEQWAAEYNTGAAENADKIVAMYADDAIMMPPDMPSASGHAAMREFLVKDMAGSKTAGITLRLDKDSAGSSGDLGWHSGTFSVLAKDGKVVGTGKFVEVWQKKDGKWTMIRDVWNNDAPVPAPAADLPAKE